MVLETNNIRIQFSLNRRPNLIMVVLSSSQIQKFKDDGFLILRANEHDLVDAVALQAWTDDVAQWPRVKGKWMPYEEINASGEKQLMRTEKFADYHEQFGKLLFGPAIADVLKQLSGDVRREISQLAS
jgi:hypothetical protein